MSDLGLADWVLAIEDVTTEKLWHLFTELEQQPDAYVDKLDIAMPGYVERAEDFIGQLREVMTLRIRATADCNWPETMPIQEEYQHERW